ncbi:MAG TPA: branched-chain amino acid ABC transporter permease [Burkholderiaceae bacterium]|nr:branched-chain amino acid ABC transporter permease [Burkholderiaceae bacterium]
MTGGAAASPQPPGHDSGGRAKRVAGAIVLAIVVAVLAALPWIGNTVLVGFGISVLLLATVAQGWNIIGGFTGYPSFGNSVFYGLGAYGVAIAMVQYGLPFWVGLLLGLALGVAFAGLLGLAVLRLKGHYFAICTLGLALVMTAIVSNLGIAGGNIGLVLPLLQSEVLFYELALALLVLATLTVFWLSRSRFGLGLIAIRENEEGAAVMGVNTTLYKVLAFMLSAAFTALAGGIYAYYITFIDPVGVFDITLNVKMIIMAVFGGPGSVLGPVVGAFILSAVAEVLATRLTSIASMFFGIVIVVAVVFMPRGITDLVRRIRPMGWRYFIDNVKTHRL